jgi:hypothetical protein
MFFAESKTDRYGCPGILTIALATPMKFRILAQIIFFLPVLHLGACRAADLQDPGHQFAEDARSYQLVIHDLDRRPFLRITCRYVGKSPDGDVWDRVPWQSVDMDFYHLVFENLTRNRIRLISQASHQLYDQPLEWKIRLGGEKTLVVKTTPDPPWIDFSKRADVYDDVLYPHSSMQKRNQYYHTNNRMPFNRLTFQTRLEYMGTEYRINYYLIYKK